VGFAWLGIGYLNMQTAFLGSIIAGNGINYGIIYLGRFGQLRCRGLPLDRACHEAAQVTAAGTLVAALGTSVAFGTLLIATNPWLPPFRLHRRRGDGDLLAHHLRAAPRTARRTDSRSVVFTLAQPRSRGEILEHAHC
jgi:hypothetical protein